MESFKDSIKELKEELKEEKIKEQGTLLRKSMD